jgi:hypothetical protein
MTVQEAPRLLSRSSGSSSNDGRPRAVLYEEPYRTHDPWSRDRPESPAFSLNAMSGTSQRSNAGLLGFPQIPGQVEMRTYLPLFHEYHAQDPLYRPEPPTHIRTAPRQGPPFPIVVDYAHTDTSRYAPSSHGSEAPQLPRTSGYSRFPPYGSETAPPGIPRNAPTIGSTIAMTDRGLPIPAMDAYPSVFHAPHGVTTDAHQFGRQSTIFGTDIASGVFRFIFYDLPKQIYLHLLLRLPQFYFSRVKRVFDDAELSKQDIVRIYLITAKQWQKKHHKRRVNVYRLPTPDWDGLGAEGDIHVTRAMRAFKASWEEFISSLISEWNTLNVISALLVA